MSEVEKTRVAAVMRDMERHCLGHEGMEDSPVARWVRELRYAIKSDARDAAEAQNPSCADPDSAADVTSEAPKVTRDHAEDVSMSAYDLLPADERDAIAWVRERGGLDYVKREWRSRVPHDRYERRRQRLLGHIAECETALGRRREIISNLGHRVSDLTRENAELRRRAMPEGMEWPRYESGEPVGFGDEVSRLGEVFSISLYCDGSFALNFRAYSKGERVRRPAKVLDADGVEIRVGETVWHIRTGDEYSVIGVPSESVINVSRQLDGREIHGVVSPYSLTHRAPVLAADGEPLEVGQTVWDTDAETDTPLTVVEVSSDLVRCEYTWKDGKTYRPCYQPDQLTHTKPEIDTWQRIEEDAGCTATKYNERRGTIFTTKQQVARDLVHRCKVLAERERGE